MNITSEARSYFNVSASDMQQLELSPLSVDMYEVSAHILSAYSVSGYWTSLLFSLYRIPKSIDSEPRSSRLKHKRRGEGETLIKKLFVEDVMKNNDLLHILAEGSSIVLLPQNSLDDSVYSNSCIASRFKGNSSFSLGLCNPEEEFKASESLGSENLMLDRKGGIKQLEGFYAVKGEFSSVCDGNRSSLFHGTDDSSTLASQTHKPNTERERTIHGHKLSDQGLFSCVTCGILSFACVAIVQPKDSAARYLMSADCGIFNDGDVGPRVTSDANFSGLDSCSGRFFQQD